MIILFILIINYNLYFTIKTCKKFINFNQKPLIIEMMELQETLIFIKITVVYQKFANLFLSILMLKILSKTNINNKFLGINFFSKVVQNPLV